MENELNNDDLWDVESSSPQENNSLEEPTSSFNPNDDSIYGNKNTEVSDNIDKSEETKPIDFLTRLLQQKGVDKNKVRIQNDEGDIEEYNFDDLDDDTKFGILNTEEELPLSDEEVNAVNYLRNQDMTLPQLIEFEKQEAIKEYLAQNQTPNYTVDQISDDDLFKFDLKDQMPDLTDEEVENQLQKAKEDTQFFEKKINALRNEYKKLEDNEKQQKETEAATERENKFNEMAQSFINVARNLDEINGMVLDNEDKEEILSFILDRDASGLTKFYRAFEDPQLAFKMAWYALKGDEAHTSLVDYFTNEIAKARKSAKAADKSQQRIIKKQKNSEESDPYGLNSIFKN